jgi:hypothetical protein
VTFTLRDATICSSSDCTIFKDEQMHLAFVLKLEGVLSHFKELGKILGKKAV